MRSIERTHLLTLSLLVSGCVRPSMPDEVTGQRAARRSIVEMLRTQADAWNRGDIERFMQPYWHAEALTFSSGGRVTRGWESTLDGYRRRYPTRESMGRLTFSELEVTLLSKTSAMVLGRWHLERAEPVGGVFTLVLRKDGGRWVIVHDHTSRRQP